MLLHSKGNHKQMKRQPTEWGKIFANNQQGIKLQNLQTAHAALCQKNNPIKKWAEGDTSRWQRSKTWRSPCSPQIPQKYIYMWNNSYRTPTEHWQKTSDFPEGKKLPMYLGRAKEKRKNRDKRIGMVPEPLGGSCKGGKDSTH